MRKIVSCLPVVLSALVLGACAPTNEAPAPAHVVPGGGGSGNAGGTGATAGSTSAGGAAASGGMSGGGGVIQGGSGGTGGDTGISGASGSAGSSGSGGGDPTGPRPTAGCGKDPGQAFGEYVQYDVTNTGETLGEPDSHTTRQIFVRLPENYDPNTPYRIVYITVGCSGSGTSGYQFWDTGNMGDPNAIYVGLARPSPDPDPPSLTGCYDNRGGVDSIEWESLEADHYFLREKFCIDENKVYTGGYSSGGWMSNMYSCYFAGVDPNRKFMPDVAIRGALATAGCWIDTNPPCSTLPVAQMWVHDEGDMAPNQYSCAVGQRDRVLAQNGCADGPDGPTEMWDVPGGQCVKYTNCPAEYPVIFCSTTNRVHSPDDDIAIPEFTKMITGMEALTP